MGLFGGLSLFLFGMEQMSEGLKAAAGEGLKGLLGRLTANRFMGALTGAFVTVIIAAERAGSNGLMAPVFDALHYQRRDFRTVRDHPYEATHDQ